MSIFLFSLFDCFCFSIFPDDFVCVLAGICCSIDLLVRKSIFEFLEFLFVVQDLSCYVFYFVMIFVTTMTSQSLQICFLFILSCNFN